MGFNYTLVNQTPSEVTFGLWNGPGKHAEVHQVKASDQEKHSAKYSDARIVGAWLDEGNLYPSNEPSTDNPSAPYVTGGYFMDGGDYTITLTKDGLKISPQ